MHPKYALNTLLFDYNSERVKKRGIYRKNIQQTRNNNGLYSALLLFFMAPTAAAAATNDFRVFFFARFAKIMVIIVRRLQESVYKANDVQKCWG